MAPRPVNELHVNTLGKIFFATLGAYAIGRMTGLIVRGSKDECEAVGNACLASRRFQQELNRDGATVQSVMQKLGLYNASKEEFENALGIEWPL